jgi:replicative DNA helicase
MTAAQKRRAPLEVVPDPEATTAGHGSEDDWRSPTVIDQWSAEHQFIGSLLWLSAAQARPLLELVPDTAIYRPQTRWAYELVRHLIDTDTDPTPASVLALARHRPDRDAINPDCPPTAHRQRQLALYLFDAYSQAISPAAAITTYARQVLDDAYRRAFDTCGIRMQQLAACGAERDDLTEQFAAIRDELADLWRRTEAARPQKDPT